MVTEVEIERVVEVGKRTHQKTEEAMLVLEIKMDVTKKDHPSFAVT